MGYINLVASSGQNPFDDHRRLQSSHLTNQTEFFGSWCWRSGSKSKPKRWRAERSSSPFRRLSRPRGLFSNVQRRNFQVLASLYNHKMSFIVTQLGSNSGIYSLPFRWSSYGEYTLNGSSHAIENPLKLTILRLSHYIADRLITVYSTDSVLCSSKWLFF